LRSPNLSRTGVVNRDDEPAEQGMPGKRISDLGGGRRTDTDRRGFDKGPNVQPGRPPGSPPPDPGDLRQPRQSGRGDKPPRGQEKARPRDTGRSGA
jgi:hypothetical protein